jgi:WD40 repeat protein
MIMKQRKLKLLSALTLCSLLFIVALAAGDADWKEQIKIKLPSKASSISYSSEGTRIAVGHPDGQVSIWNVKSGELVKQLNAHSKKVNSVQFILQDSQLLTIGDDNRARLWSTSDWSDAGVIEGPAFSGGASPDGRWLAAQASDQSIWLWDLSTLTRVEQLKERGKGGTRNITFTADARYIATAYSTPWLINVKTKESVSLVNSGDKKTDLRVEQQGNQTSISLGPLQDDDAPTHRVIPSRSGSFVALGRGWYGQTAFVDLWDLTAMKRIGRYKTKNSGTLTSFSFDNSLLAVEGAEKVTIWRIGKGKQVGSVTGGGIMQFSPKTMELAVTDGANLIIYVPK